MEEKIIKLQEENNKLLLDIRAKYEELEKEKITAGEFKEFREKVEKRMDEIDKEIVKSKRVVMDGDGDKGVERKVFEKVLRKGVMSLAPEEMKVLSVSDPTTGGFLAPAEFVAEVIKGISDYSPIRTLARITTTSSRSKQYPRKSQSASASWIAELGSRAETQGIKFKLEEIPTHELYAMSVISKQDLEDVSYDLEAEVKEDFAEQFGVSEGTAFVSGNGVGKPEGILSCADVSGFTGVTTSAKVVADDLKQVFYGLKEVYAKNAVWIWNRQTTLAISLLKDTGAGNYLWRPGLEAGEPPNVLGRAYVECPDMPTESASAKAVAIGDWKRGYMIVDRVVMEMMIDPYSSKGTGCVEISARRRVGGQVVLPEAIKIYTLKG